MNWRAIRAIVRKDLAVVTRSRSVMIPLIIVPVVFLVVLPGLAALIPGQMNLPGSSLAQMTDFLKQMPPGLLAELDGLNDIQQVTGFLLLYMFAPLFLIIPLMVSSVIAADSFAGEKERKTLEALLYSPTTDRELFLAKILSAWVPAVVIALVSFVLYGVVANLAAWPVMGRVFFPTAMWIALVIWVAPATAGLGLGAMVLVSVRAQSFQDAYQLGAMAVIPVLLLLFGQATGVMYFNVGLVVLLGLVFWAIDGALFWFGVRTFRRDKLAARL
jgi:ABC-2 type transport system permease protein